MKIFDISMQIDRDMPVYQNRSEKKPVIRVVSDYTQGHSYESRITLNMHTGTHVDAPLHMLERGDSVDRIDLNRLITPCKVVDLSAVSGQITAADFVGQTIAPGDFILCKTKNSTQSGFVNDFVYLDRDGARYLCERQINGVGIDSLGIERDQPEHATHKLLLEAGIIILEGLRLSGINPGAYLLIAAPLKIAGAEASPVRAVLLEPLH